MTNILLIALALVVIVLVFYAIWAGVPMPPSASEPEPLTTVTSTATSRNSQALVDVTITRDSQSTTTTMTEKAASDLINTLKPEDNIMVSIQASSFAKAYENVIRKNVNPDALAWLERSQQEMEAVLTALSFKDIAAGKGPFVALSITTPLSTICLFLASDHAIKIRQHITLLGKPGVTAQIHPGIGAIAHDVDGHGREVRH